MIYYKVYILWHSSSKTKACKFLIGSQRHSCLANRPLIKQAPKASPATKCHLANERQKQKPNYTMPPGYGYTDVTSNLAMPY